MSKAKTILSINYSKKALEIIKKARSTMILPAKVDENQEKANKNLEKPRSDNKGKQNRKDGLFKKTLNYLRASYPKCFTNSPSPLAVRIHKQLQEQINVEGMPFKNNRNIYVFLYFYTNTLNYKSACVAGAERKNLDGSVHSIITEEEVQNREK